MTIAALLVLIGTILCCIAAVVDRVRPSTIGGATVVAAGATLIGIGVLLGHPGLAR